jgi:hypothetical protein
LFLAALGQSIRIGVERPCLAMTDEKERAHGIAYTI